MKSNFINFYLLVTFVIIIFGCSDKKELSKPKIFKELKLGMDLDSAVNLINDNVCSKDLKPINFIYYQTDSDNWPVTISPLEKKSFCQYNITENIFAAPNIFYGKLNGKKIVSSATLLFHSPSSFPLIEVKEYDGVHGYQLPALSDYETDKIVEMYDAQYGKRIENTFRATYTWANNDLIISLYKDKYMFLGDTVLTIGANRVVVTYKYSDEKIKLIEFDKVTKSGEKVGDKI